MFVALVYTPQSGMWLTATPETLLSGIDGRWQTMALAGTMPWSDEVLWSDKNLQEQRYVATYITRQLEHFTSDFTEDGPYTARAGHLAHLRSDFRFTLLDNARMGDLLFALHPTPAVCGLPKQATYEFILENEHTPRLYYSGFMGPLNLRLPEGCLLGKKPQTHLFVSLRCMQITDSQYRMFAGGGLLKDSIEEQEWQETEAKLETMRRVLTE
jgi:isochorismate synthase